MTYRDAQDLAVQFGAKKFTRGAECYTFECWADRIAWLPRAAELGKAKLAAAIEEANRYV